MWTFIYDKKLLFLENIKVCVICGANIFLLIYRPAALKTS